MEAPCKNCESRKVGCHSVCEKYTAYNRYREQVRFEQMINGHIKFAGIKIKNECVKWRTYGN
jgi:hypothetical protein